MNSLVAIFRELIGLFVDDGALALAIAGVIILAASLASVFPQLPIIAGATLLLGCLSVLFVNVLKAASR
jgi:hypothetical protein